MPDLKAELRPLQISAAREVDVKGGKKAIVVFVPVPQVKAFHKIQGRCVFFTGRRSASVADSLSPSLRQPHPRAREEVLGPPRRLHRPAPHDAQAHPWLARQAAAPALAHPQGGAREDPRGPRLPDCASSLLLHLGGQRRGADLTAPLAVSSLRRRRTADTHGDGGFGARDMKPFGARAWADLRSPLVLALCRRSPASAPARPSTARRPSRCTGSFLSFSLSFSQCYSH